MKIFAKVLFIGVLGIIASFSYSQITVGDPKIEGFYQGFINQKIPIEVKLPLSTTSPTLIDFSRPIQVLGLFRVQIRLNQAGYYQGIARNAVIFDSGRRYTMQADLSIIPEFPSKDNQIAYYNFRTDIDPPGELDFEFELTGQLKRVDRKRGEYFDKIAYEDDEGKSVVSFVATELDVVLISPTFPQPPVPNTRVELAKIAQSFFGFTIAPKIYR